MYKSITNAIAFALQEVRYAQRETIIANDDDCKDIIKMLINVENKLYEAQDELNPF